MAIHPLFDEPFLRAQWDADFRAFEESPEAAAQDATIATRETAHNAITYRLYRLTPEEVATVEAG
jgi:hypothetical protein